MESDGRNDNLRDPVLTAEQLELLEPVINQLVNEALSVSGKNKITNVISKNAKLLAETAATFGYINGLGTVKQ